jgi:hypothetical protein
MRGFRYGEWSPSCSDRLITRRMNPSTQWAGYRQEARACLILAKREILASSVQVVSVIVLSCKWKQWRVGIAQSVQRRNAGWTAGVWFPGEARDFFSSPQRSDRNWSPHSLLSSKYWGLFPRRRSSLHLLPRLRQTFSRLHGVISQKIVLFSIWLVRRKDLISLFGEVDQCLAWGPSKGPIQLGRSFCLKTEAEFASGTLRFQYDN